MMSVSSNSALSGSGPDPFELDQLFATTHQNRYASHLMERGGLTRSRANYFVRMWAYLQLKQQVYEGNAPLSPIAELAPIEEFVPCTHREAAEIFYGHQSKGSDRAAGMMLDKLVALGLMEKRFDGQTLQFRIPAIPELAASVAPPADTVSLVADDFNPRTDAIPSANLLIRNYAELTRDPAAASHKTARALRRWADAYPECMRVLRRSDNLNPVALMVLYPVASQSETYFFQAPSRSFYLTNDTEPDPFEMAEQGDPDCTSVYVRAWILDPAYMKGENLYLMLEDTRQTLTQMHAVFPKLCDVYSLVIHPVYEELRIALGFQKTFQDPQRPYHWIYLALDRFLALDFKQVLATLAARRQQSQDP